MTVVPGPEYRAGWLQRKLVGTGYRDLWNTPIRVPVLNLDRFAGGLTVEKVGATGGQTWSLHVYGADGNEYTLRSVDKHVKLAPEVASGTVAWILRDQISAGLATGALIVGHLMRASGVLHEEPTLVVLPDSPRLGPYRQQFAGLLVWVENRARGPGGAEDMDPDAPGFAGASKISKTDAMLKAIGNKPDEHFDSRGYLTARLMDMIVGDWDRGPTQWWWARFGDKHDHIWRPIPHDRDWAFGNFDGILYAFLRPNVPWFVQYKPHYPNLIGLLSQAWGQDRRLLQDLNRAAWDSTANWLKAALTDSVIDDAVAQLPPPELALYGERLRRALRGRRDALPAMAASAYRIIASQANVRTINVPSVVEITRRPDTVEIRATARESEHSSDDPVVYYDRRFDAKTTHEIRLYLDGGPDSVVVAGGGDHIRVRLIAGADGDVVVDGSAPGAGATPIYDGGHPVRVIAEAGNRPPVDDRLYKQPTLGANVPEATRQPASFLLRDAGSWCEPLTSGTISSVAGVAVEQGESCSGFGFRRIPWATQQTGNIGFAFGPGGILGDYTASLRAIGGWPIWSLHVEGTSAEYRWFYGTGNATPHPLPDDDYRARESRVGVTPTVTLDPISHLAITIGPELRYWDAERSPVYFAATSPYGAGPFGVVDGHVDAVLDSRDPTANDSSGVRLELSGRAVPAWWDAALAYGTAHAEVAGFAVIPGLPLHPFGDVRAGADKVWGIAPFQDLPEVGGPTTVEGYYPGRFSGDAAVYAHAQLYLPVARLTLVAPGEVGVTALNDVGRVFLAGEHSSVWHDGFGGGLWSAYFDRRYLIALTLVHSVEHNIISGGFGLGF